MRRTEAEPHQVEIDSRKSNTWIAALMTLAGVCLGILGTVYSTHSSNEAARTTLLMQLNREDKQDIYAYVLRDVNDLKEVASGLANKAKDSAAYSGFEEYDLQYAEATKNIDINVQQIKIVASEDVRGIIINFEKHKEDYETAVGSLKGAYSETQQDSDILNQRWDAVVEQADSISYNYDALEAGIRREFGY